MRRAMPFKFWTLDTCTTRNHHATLRETLSISMCYTFCCLVPPGAGKTHTMMGSERVVGTRTEGDSEEVSGIVPQSLVELFRLLEERMEDGCGPEEGGGVEAWGVRVGYLQVGPVMPYYIMSVLCCAVLYCAMLSVLHGVTAITLVRVPGGYAHAYDRGYVYDYCTVLSYNVS